MARRRESVRPAGEVLEGFLAALESGWAPGLTLLTGEDAWYRDRAERALLARLTPDDGDAAGSAMSTTVVSEGKHDVAQIVSAARSVGMFSPARIVWVRDLALLEGEPEPLEAYAAGPPAGSHVVIRGEKLDLRRKLHKALARAARHYEFPAGEPFDARRLRDVRDLAASRGVELDRETVGFLSAACLGDMERVEREIEKIATWLGDRPSRRVTPDDLRDVVRGSDLLSGWELADAFADRDLARALASVRRLAGVGEEPIRLVGGLAWRARQLLAARARAAAGMPESRVLEGAFGAQREALRRALGRYRYEETLAFPSTLLRADRTLKSRTLSGATVLETLMESLVGRGSAGSGR